MVRLVQLVRLVRLTPEVVAAVVAPPVAPDKMAAQAAPASSSCLTAWPLPLRSSLSLPRHGLRPLASPRLSTLSSRVEVAVVAEILAIMVLPVAEQEDSVQVRD